MRDTGPRGKQRYFFHWSIIALQCCITFYGTAKSINHMHVYLLPPKEGRGKRGAGGVTLVGSPSLPVKG